MFGNVYVCSANLRQDLLSLNITYFVGWGLVINSLTKQKQKYDDKGSKAIDKVLRKILGDEATLLIYKHLENRYSLRQDEIIEKIDVFAEGLEKLLSSGAYVIKKNILENAYSSYGLTRRLGFERAESDMSFVSQMKMLQ
jgi:NDP-sugar pyrophosphorylase family protein